jgi:glutamyl/glutaminyl-tRNA synthetase
VRDDNGSLNLEDQNPTDTAGSAPPGVCRFAPSTTGEAHPGTLLAALLCWLDARKNGDRVLLRLENLDPDRSTPAFEDAMQQDLAWLGLDWDEVTRQSDNQSDYEEALDRLAEEGQLYPCSCSRAEIRASGVRTPDGGYRYDNRCRDRALPPGGWRASEEPLRARLPEGTFTAVDLAGEELTQDPTAGFGDPIVRRRDGAIAYQLACVVDDATSGVTRIVRGRDIMSNTATQAAIQASLGFGTPVYRHHMLLLERQGEKLAKLHGSVGATALREVYSAAELCGVLVFAAGMVERLEPMTPTELLEGFSWDRVSHKDQLAHWTGRALEVSGAQGQ